MKKWILILPIVAFILLSPSCREKSQMNSRIVVTAIGIDGVGQDSRVSVQAIEALKTSGSLSEQEGNATQVYAAQGRTVSGALTELVTEAGRYTYIMHNQLLAVGMEQAKAHSLPELLNYFVSGQNIRPDVQLVLCRGSAQELLGVPSESFTIPAEYIGSLLDEEKRWGKIVPCELLDAERAMSGMFDAAIPIVRVRQTGDGEEAVQTIVTDGTAVFRDGRLVGELDTQETRGLALLDGSLKNCLVEVGDGENGLLAVECSSVHTSIRVAGNALPPTFDVKISLNAKVSEKAGTEAARPDSLRSIQSQVAAIVQNETEEVLNHSARELGADLMGLKRMTMKQQPSLIRGHESQWPELLKQARFHVSVNVNVSQISSALQRD